MTSETLNPYSYLNKEEFTSEIFKCEIKNLPPKVAFSQLKKRLNTIDVNPHKMKILKGVTFVTFKSEEERDKAIQVITGHVWKERTLLAKIAAARTDPFVQKRKNDADDTNEPSNKQIKIENDERTIEEKLKDHVIKFWRKSYEEQLLEKSNKLKIVLNNYTKKIKKECRDFVNIKNVMCTDGEFRLPCPLEQIIASPNQLGYRNKCEYTIGMTEEGYGPIAGFCHGKYKSGIDSVGHINKSILIIPDVMVELVEKTNELLRKLCEDNDDLKLTHFTPSCNEGHLRGLTIRTGGLTDSLKEDQNAMLIFDINPQDITEEKLEILGKKIVEFYSEEKRVSSILISCRKNNSDAFDWTTTKLLYGQGYLYERLMNLNFRISFNAFFQVNTEAANTLYQTIEQVLRSHILQSEQTVSMPTKKVTLLDICCGTGTIGLAMSHLVDQVVGIEMVAESIEDAKFNAKLNNIENASFHVGRAEDVIDQLLVSYSKSSRDDNNREFVAIVDPPRNGLHSSVIHAIRKCNLIKHVIYVSCNPESAITNFTDFSRPLSKRMAGDPFIPQSAVPVDLFPQTPHVELVMLLTRQQ